MCISICLCVGKLQSWGLCKKTVSICVSDLKSKQREGEISGCGASSQPEDQNISKSAAVGADGPCVRQNARGERSAAKRGDWPERQGENRSQRRRDRERKTKGEGERETRERERQFEEYIVWSGGEL